MHRIAMLIALLLPAAALAQDLKPADEVAKQAAALATKMAEKEANTLTVAAELGGSYTSGNTNTRNLNASLNLAWAFAPKWLSTTKFQGIYARFKPDPTIDEERDSAASWLASERADRYLSERFGLFAAASMERNPFGGIGRRLAGQLGATYLIVVSNSAQTPDLIEDRLNLDAGFYGAREHYVTVPYVRPAAALPDDATIAAARAALDYVHRFAKGREVGATVELIEDFVDTSNTVASGSAYVAAAFTQVLSVKLSAAYRYDNVVPDAATNEDLLLTAGLLVNL